ncbi:MAG: hypothetical protein WCW30_00295 [Candidatus Gracilibacteria bacterium]
MHKFTIFTLLFSVCVVLIVADLVLNDYWGKDFASQDAITEQTVPDETIPDEIPPDEIVADPTPTPITDETPVTDPELYGDEETNPNEIETTVPDEPALKPTLTQALTADLGLTESILETESYTGLIFGFWDLSASLNGAPLLRHKLFDGTTFLGSIYEIQGATEVDLFSLYEALRTLANTSGTGTINENNAYGEASFYFNHMVKTNTVFLTVRTQNAVYAFEYAPSAHVQMKKLISLLMAL